MLRNSRVYGKIVKMAKMFEFGFKIFVIIYTFIKVY